MSEFCVIKDEKRHKIVNWDIRLNFWWEGKCLHACVCRFLWICFCSWRLTMSFGGLKWFSCGFLVSEQWYVCVVIKLKCFNIVLYMKTCIGHSYISCICSLGFLNPSSKEELGVIVAAVLVLIPLRFSSFGWILWKALHLNGRMTGSFWIFLYFKFFGKKWLYTLLTTAAN